VSAKSTRPLYARTLGELFEIKGRSGTAVTVDALPIEIEPGWWFTFDGQWYRITGIEQIGTRRYDNKRGTILFECHVNPKIHDCDVLYFKQYPPETAK